MIYFGCSSNEFCNATGCSPSSVSRFRNGVRVPDYNSNILNNIIIGICKIAKEKNIDNLTEKVVKEEFKKTYGNKAFNFNSVRNNLNSILFEFNINKNKMSRSIGFDASYISRVSSGSRKPSNEENFVNLVCRYIAENYYDNQSKKKIVKLTGIKNENLNTKESYIKALTRWMTSDKNDTLSPVNKFLKKLDEFNLEDFIKSIKFDELKIPTLPFQFTSSKNYYGLDDMKKGELDFFKTTILSKSTGSILMYNDMPMEDMAEDIEFGKKWMFAIAAALKKGFHLNMIHNLNRPFNELMLGLESYIPMYMTGQISPYYFKTPTSNIFNHTIYFSDACALSGDGLSKYHNSAKYYLTNKKDELPFYKEYANNLLQQASPLMNIYTKENEKEFNKFIKQEKENDNNIICNIKNKELEQTFKNITFTSCKDKWVIISKKTNPEIHFVIFHQKLRNAIESFTAPIVE